MNYLAHILLSGEQTDMMVGGLLGDFVKGPLHGNYPQSIEDGIILHRRIDAFTDQQPEILTATARFKAPFRRYGGIYLDICHDHFLAKHWHKFHPHTLTDFCATFYASLEKHYALLPPRARRFSELAPKINWLESYKNFENLEFILEKVGERLKHSFPLQQGYELLQQDYPLLEKEFERLFPKLIQFADSQRQQL